MANTEHVEIVQSVGLEVIEGWIDEPDTIPPLVTTGKDGTVVEKHPTSTEATRLAERLKFVRLRYLGYSVAESAHILNVNRQSCYNWQTAWNKNGVQGLYPGFDGGAPSKLTDQQKDDLTSYVEGREMCTDDVVDHIKRAYSVEYSGMQVSRILRSRGLVYRRGYKIDHKRNPHPEDDLKKTSSWYWTRPEQMT